MRISAKMILGFRSILAVGLLVTSFAAAAQELPSAKPESVGLSSERLDRIAAKVQQDIDQKRILCCLQNMRMLCNSTFLFDKQTNHSPKLAEFREIVRELTVEEDRKVVVFSEYERMTHLAGEELKKRGIGFVSLHGGVPSRNRAALMEKFRGDAECRVFLSTDAGGVGLNLQTASAVVNFEPPWNPARLEQRVGRVHRLGQAHPVHVVHLLTKDSIEERVWETLKVKKSLFDGVFDSPTGEVSFAALGKKSVLQAVKEIFADQPGRPKPLIDQPPAKAVPIQSVPKAASPMAGSQPAGFEQRQRPAACELALRARLREEHCHDVRRSSGAAPAPVRRRIRAQVAKPAGTAGIRPLWRDWRGDWWWGRCVPNR